MTHPQDHRSPSRRPYTPSTFVVDPQHLCVVHIIPMVDCKMHYTALVPAAQHLPNAPIPAAMVCPCWCAVHTIQSIRFSELATSKHPELADFYEELGMTPHSPEQCGVLVVEHRNPMQRLPITVPDHVPVTAD